MGSPGKVKDGKIAMDTGIGRETGRGSRSLLERLEALYCIYNRKEYISPDPLETLFPYQTLRDREAAGFVVSAISYGRASQIVKSARKILSSLGPSPWETLREASPVFLEEKTKSFRHRFTSGLEMGMFLGGMGKILREYGSLEELLWECLRGKRSRMDGFIAFVRKIRGAAGFGKGSLLSSPEDGSACKRFFLYLKWMTRQDGVDPGGWSVIVPRDLVIPLDVHMFRICSALRLVTRRSADLKTALEATEAFRELQPEDPAKYDFVLTRFGIRADLDESSLVESCLGGDEA